MKTELTETLIRAIQSDLYERLSTLFNLSDADIDAIGLGRLIPEPNEPDEEPLKVFSFVYHAYLDTVVTVEAHNEAEAEALAEKECENICYADMECYESGLDRIAD